jgi:hypothetical protein
MKNRITLILAMGTLLVLVSACATPDAVEQDSKAAWKETKKTSGEVWEGTKKVSGEAWDGTKKVSGEAWDDTKKSVNNATAD